MHKALGNIVMTQSSDKVRWTISDVELLATDEWKRYEIIDGELFVSREPHIRHQYAIGSIYAKLLARSDSKSDGQPIIAPGVIFSDSDSVIPDIIWISNGRLAQIVNSFMTFNRRPRVSCRSSLRGY